MIFVQILTTHALFSQTYTLRFVFSQCIKISIMHFCSKKTDLLSSAWKSLEGIKTDINKIV